MTILPRISTASNKFWAWGQGYKNSIITDFITSGMHCGASLSETFAVTQNHMD